MGYRSQWDSFFTGQPELLIPDQVRDFKVKTMNSGTSQEEIHKSLVELLIVALVEMAKGKTKSDDLDMVTLYVNK